jgi:hypothetical protein
MTGWLLVGPGGQRPLDRRELPDGPPRPSIRRALLPQILDRRHSAACKAKLRFVSSTAIQMGAQYAR